MNLAITAVQSHNKLIKVRPFLKWPGSKYSSLGFILPKLPKAKILVEPFVGSGAVFLNTEYDEYILGDANLDLINLYRCLQMYGYEFIEFCKQFFLHKNNTSNRYYSIRDQFNEINIHKDPTMRSALFLYLNRHGYNGLCRFNKNNKFNVPFGLYNKLTFPEDLMKHFLLKAKKARFLYRDFKELLIGLEVQDAVIYCDPPYVPLSSTAKFSHYQSGGFNMNNQQILVDLAINKANNGCPVLISNHYTEFTAALYKQATSCSTFKIRRTISCNVKKRNYVTEILAFYG